MAIPSRILECGGGDAPSTCNGKRLLLERDACGPPSDEKLQALAEALGEPHAENLFAKADRVTPRVVNIILQHPTE